LRRRARAHLRPHSFPTRRASDLLHPVAFVRTIGAYVRDCTFFPPRAALPAGAVLGFDSLQPPGWLAGVNLANADGTVGGCRWFRSEEHTSELQSRENLVCRLLLE